MSERTPSERDAWVWDDRDKTAQRKESMMRQHTPGLTTAKCGCLYAGGVQMCPTHAKAQEMKSLLEIAVDVRRRGPTWLKKARALLKEIEG